MIAYKFRGNSEEDLKHTLDIVVKRELFCAEWTSLNDPMEAHFLHAKTSPPSVADKAFLAGLKRAKKSVRLCSLSTRADCRLLWGHYASGFRGVAIEVDLPDKTSILPPNVQIERIRYLKEIPRIARRDSDDLETRLRKILFTKYLAWSYEDEVRIASTERFYPLPKPITRIIVGQRIDPWQLGQLRAIDPSIRIDRARLTNTGVSIVPDSPG